MVGAVADPLSAHDSWAVPRATWAAPRRADSTAHGSYQAGSGTGNHVPDLTNAVRSRLDPMLLLARVGQSLDATPLATDEAHATAVDDRTFYLHPKPAERDLAALGGLLTVESS